MKVEIVRASAEDYPRLVDFINLVFSYSDRPHDFPSLLPKVYRDAENSREKTRFHTVVKEDGEIRACVLAYPVCLSVCGETLYAAGIGSVSVHPYSRSKGYMRTLMGRVLADMREQGADFSVLGGQRQRYGYFGYERCGISVRYTVTPVNLRHTAARLGDFPADQIEMRRVGAGDTTLLDSVAQLYRRQALYTERPDRELFDILSSWNGETNAFLYDGRFVGYSVGDGAHVWEMGACDNRAYDGMIRRLVEQKGKKGVAFRLYPHQTGLIDVLNGLCEEYRIDTDTCVRVFRFDRVIQAFLKLRARHEPLEDGSLTFAVEDFGALTVCVQDGEVQVKRDTGKPVLFTLGAMEAQNLLMSPVGGAGAFRRRLPGFARAWFPLSVSLPQADHV